MREHGLRRIITLLLVIFLLAIPALPASANTNGWTWINPVPQGNHLRAVWGIAGNNVYAVGDIGTLLHYNGRAWQPIDLGTYEGLTSVWGRGPNDVYVVGRQGSIYHYDGSSWAALPSPTTSELTDIRGVGNALLIVGSGGVVVAKGALPAVEYAHQYLPLVTRAE